MSAKGSLDTDLPDPEKVSFDPIEQLRAHEYVAEQLRHHIGLGLIPFGTTLPPERDLARMFGVGRSTIQAALRVLESDRLVESRRGRGGGTFVIEPSRDKASHERTLLDIRLAAEEVEDALRFRRVVEEGAVAQAVEAAGPEDVAALRATSARMQETTEEFEFHRLDTEFHVALARASHSPMLREAVERARLALNQAILAQPGTEAWHSRINGEHERIIDAIEAGNARKAAKAIDVHLQRTESGIRALIATVS